MTASRCGMLLLVSCVAAGVTLSRAAEATGESDSQGFPNWAERVMHEWSNRARCEPQIEMTACGNACPEKACYTAVAPLWYSNGHNRAARFHSDEMVRQGYFAHDSTCQIPTNIGTLYPATCDGSASCACTGGTPATTWNGRILLFASSAGGEIIASPSDPNSAFYLWLFENYDHATCAFDYGPPTNGHRWNILKSNGVVGYGTAGYSTGDFGSGGTPSKIPSAAHYPRQSSSVQVWANWYDTAAPLSATVNVGGTCAPLSRKRGSTLGNGNLHEAWSATLTNVATGCFRYYLEFTDSASNVVTWPTTGSLGIGPAASCPDWDSTRPAACGCIPSCAGKQCGDDGCGSQCGTCNTGWTCTSAGQCTCTPNCTGKVCGNDGCGGVCGPGCTAPQTCNASGQCVTPCVPNCAGKTCGDDGCGGTCAPGCTGASVCQNGTCVCVPDCAGKQCGNDGCTGTCGTCTAPLTCNAAFQCACTPSCAGKQCGDNGCGGSCGTCAGSKVCVNNKCVNCTPDCTGKVCGSDGCKGTCGPGCSGGEVCQNGACVGCTPSCTGKECGDDGCGSTCAPGCTAPEACNASGVCVCVPNCVGKPCGPDGCQGSCGTCGSGLVCQGNACVCVPSCTGKACGDDGCGSTCGVCGGGEQCVAGACVLFEAGVDATPDVIASDGAADALVEATAEAAADVGAEASQDAKPDVAPDAALEAAADAPKDAKPDGKVPDGAVADTGSAGSVGSDAAGDAAPSAGSPAEGDDGGCGCRTQGGSRPAGWLALLAFAALLRRRSRS